MKRRYFHATGTLCAVVVWLIVPVAGQAQKAARTPDGQPDLQGVWDFRTITPLERPKSLGNKQVLSDEEAATFERELNRSQNRDLIDPKKGGAGIYVPETEGGVVPYNEFWYDRGSKVVGSKRTSLIVDPADGRLPSRTPEGERRAATQAAADAANQVGRPHADSYEQRPLTERCILGFNAGPPMMPSAYNNNTQIVQSAGYVTIINEMVHDARIVPLDGRLRLGIPQKHGESRGRWDGDTLVVDTTNFAHETSLAGSTAHMHLVERFTRVDAETLRYEFTVDDPTEWTRPWTVQMSMVRNPEPLYEYACHEGNYGLPGVLAGARAADKARNPR